MKFYYNSINLINNLFFILYFIGILLSKKHTQLLNYPEISSLYRANQEINSPYNHREHESYIFFAAWWMIKLLVVSANIFIDGTFKICP